LIVSTFNLSKQRRRGTLQNALHTSFRGTTTPSLARNPDKDAIAIPGVVELMISDIDIVSAVIPNRKTKSLAATSKSSIYKFIVARAGDNISITARQNANF
jgi:hypothetical protein